MQTKTLRSLHERRKRVLRDIDTEAGALIGTMVKKIPKRISAATNFEKLFTDAARDKWKRLTSGSLNEGWTIEITFTSGPDVDVFTDAVREALERAWTPYADVTFYPESFIDGRGYRHDELTVNIAFK